MTKEPKQVYPEVTPEQHHLHNRFMLDHADAHAREAIRAVFLINGGALIAAMTYVGQIHDRLQFCSTLLLIGSVLSFGFGLSLAVLTSQLCVIMWHHASSVGLDWSGDKIRSHWAKTWMVNALLIGSLCAFAVGLALAGTTLAVVQATPTATSAKPAATSPQ